MQRTKKLTVLLRDLLALVEDEAQLNPQFAQRLEEILATVQGERPAKKPGGGRASNAQELVVPDVFSEFVQRGEEEFRFWLQHHDLVTLKAIVRTNGFDPQRRISKWNDPDRFVELIVKQVIARRNRGSAFLES